MEETYVYSDEKQLRADIFLAESTGKTRSYISKLMKDNHVFINGEPAKAGSRLKTGDEVEIEFPEEILEIQPENIPIQILFEDDDIAVINKQPGITVHPASPGETGTLVAGLLNLSGLSGINGVLRPGIVHRLDKDTSGIMIVAKNDAAHKHLAAQFENRQVDKQYIAVLKGELKADKGRIEFPIGRSRNDRKKMAVVSGGRECITGYETIVKNTKYSVPAIRLYTGRTHQIRVHFSYIGHSVVGDQVYGKQQPDMPKRQMLHSAKIGFMHLSGKQMRFCAPLVDDMKQFIEENFCAEETAKIYEWFEKD